jgi:hypothetical protein
MTINIYPEDIVKRCLWDTYVYYVIGGSEKEAERILKENSFDVKPDSINFVVKNNVFDKSTSKIEKEMESYSNAFSSTNILC